jgi:hypothetical protein
MDLYIYSLIRLHSVVLNWISTGTNSPFTDNCSKLQKTLALASRRKQYLINLMATHNPENIININIWSNTHTYFSSTISLHVS